MAAYGQKDNVFDFSNKPYLFPAFLPGWQTPLWGHPPQPQEHPPLPCFQL